MDGVALYMQKSKSQFKNYSLAALAIFVSFLVAAPVLAAEAFFKTETPKIRAGQLFEVSVFINTDKESVNAIEGKVMFPRNLLEVKNINDGNSIINFWLERPKAKNGEILFSGIIPGGYRDENSLIFSLIFQSIREGRGLIEIRDLKALLNDGEGTEADMIISNLPFVISGQAPAAQPAISEIKDIDMPEAFTPIVASDPAIFGGKYFLVFATQDKGSGIDKYLIHESRGLKKQIAANKWLEAESPHALKDQKLKSYIYIKAVDKSGNERIATVEPRYPLEWHDRWRIWSVIILGFFVLAVMGKILWKKSQNTREI